MAKQDGHKPRSGEDYNRSPESIRHHGSMECKHLTHMVLQGPYDTLR